jgi:pimeloyl-ACP methyl ester carboxylesterase
VAHLVELGRGSDDLLPSLREIACPVLVMTGDSDPAATPDDAADIVAARFGRKLHKGLRGHVDGVPPAGPFG